MLYLRPNAFSRGICDLIGLPEDLAAARDDDEAEGVLNVLNLRTSIRKTILTLSVEDVMLKH